MSGEWCCDLFVLGASYKFTYLLHTCSCGIERFRFRRRIGDWSSACIYIVKLRMLVLLTLYSEKKRRGKNVVKHSQLAEQLYKQDDLRNK